MGSRIEAFLNLALAAAALSVAGVAVDRHLRPHGAKGLARISTPPTAVENWDALLNQGSRMGDASAPVQIVEFGDLECPFCRTFHESVQRIRAERPRAVALTFYHYPLTSIHKFAEPAALASICAEEQAAFSGYLDKIFAGQDSLGLRSWGSFASAAGVPDTIVFNDCLGSDRARNRLATDVDVGDRIGVSATPTVMVNGLRYWVPPRPDSLRAIVDRILVGSGGGAE